MEALGSCIFQIHAGIFKFITLNCAHTLKLTLLLLLPLLLVLSLSDGNNNNNDKSEVRSTHICTKWCCNEPHYTIHSC